MPVMSYARAIREALAEELDHDPLVFIMGQDVGAFGGAFGITKGLQERFGRKRVFDTPISENFIAGGAVGAALTGLRPVVELQYADFIEVAMDEIYNKAAKWRYMHGSLQTVPMVLRAPSGAANGAGPEHSQCPESLLLSASGLHVITPSTPADAKGLLKSAIRSDNPVIYFEHKGLYGMKGEVPEGEHLVPIGVADTVRSGSDVTVVAWQAMVHRSLRAAETLARRASRSRSSTRAACVPSTWTRFSRRCGAPAGWSWCMRPPRRATSRAKCPPPWPSRPSSTSPLQFVGSAGPTSRFRRALGLSSWRSRPFRHRGGHPLDPDLTTHRLRPREDHRAQAPSATTWADDGGGPARLLAGASQDSPFAIGDVLYEVETEKVTTGVEATVAGSLVRVLVAQDDRVEVGAVLGVIAEPGEQPIGGGDRRLPVGCHCRPRGGSARGGLGVSRDGGCACRAGRGCRAGAGDAPHSGAGT